MLTYNDLEYQRSTPCVVALGCFDGVHKAHTKVIEKAVEIARLYSLPSLVWSFSEPPRKFCEARSVPVLTDSVEKERLISLLGTDILVSVEFDERIASVSAEEFFFDHLISRLHATHIVCGYNFTFGAGGKGNTALLERLCKENGIGFTAIESVEIDKIAVSSSEIRKLLSLGETEKAKELLGRYYSINAVVSHGKQLGRTLGFPTINQKLGDLSPLAFGVYFTRVSLDNKRYFGITNVGTRPTVNGNGVVAETNIFDFADNVYGKTARVEFLRFLRPETKFDSTEALAAQVELDISVAKAMADNYK